LSAVGPMNARYANGARTPGIADGGASERLTREVAQVTRDWPSTVTRPVGCRPLTAPPATSSSEPRGAGARLKFPTRFMSPVNAVARSVGGSIVVAVPYAATLLSFSRSHGWK